MQRAFWLACGLVFGIPVGWVGGSHQTEPLPGLPGVAPNEPNAANERSDLDGTRAALKRLLGEDINRPGGGERSYQSMLFQYIDALAGVQPIETARLICDAGLSEVRENTLLFAVARRWFAQSGSVVLDSPELHRDGMERFRWPVFASVANELPLEALPRVMKLSDDELRDRTFINLILGAQGAELDRVLDAMLSVLPDANATTLRVLGPEIAAKDPQRTIDWLEKLTPEERRALGSQTFEIVARADPRRVLQLIDDGVFPSDLTSVQAGLLELARLDAPAAIEYLGHVDDVELRARLGGQIVRGWGEVDPEATVRWLVSLDPDHAPGGGYQWLAYAWGRSDLDAALEFVDQLPEQQRALWIMSLAPHVLDQRRDRYLGWVAQYRAEPYYPSLVAQLPLSSDDPDSAEALVLSLEPGVRTEGWQRLIQTYGIADPARAATWVAQIADERVRIASARDLASSWAQENRLQAIAWAQSLPLGSLKDAAMAGVVATLPDSVDLADQISSRETRVAALLGAGAPRDLPDRLVVALKQISLDERQWIALEARARQTHESYCMQCVQYPVVY